MKEHEEGRGDERRVSTWLLILRDGDLRGRALKSELLAQKNGAPCRMVSGRDVNSAQWVAGKNGIRKYPANACIGVLTLLEREGRKEKERERGRTKVRRRTMREESAYRNS